MQNNPLTAVMEFKKDDSITIQIMANAASIVPKACDILGISLSDSESEEDSDEPRTAEITGDRCPKSQNATRLKENREVNNENFATNNNAEVQLVQDARPKPKFHRAREGNPTEGNLTCPINDKGTGGSESDETTLALGRKEELLRKSRKRCASTPSSLGQSSSQGTSSREGNSNPPKRRFPSISSATASLVGSSSHVTASTISTNISTSSAAATRSTLFANPASSVTNLSPEAAAIRRKMLADLEIFHKQMTELAAVEKTKVRLLKKFIHISNSLNKLREERQAGRQTPTEALQVVHEAGMDEGEEDAAALFQGTNSTASNNLLSNTASSVNQIEITFDEGPSFNESFVDHPYDQQIFTEADLSLGAEETVVIDGEVIQDSDDVVGGLF